MPLRERKLLERLLAYANADLVAEDVIGLGPFYSQEGIPRLMVESLGYRQGWDSDAVVVEANRLLLASMHPGLLEGQVNRARLSMAVWSAPLRQDGAKRPERLAQSVVTPCCTHMGEMPIAVLTVALLTPTGVGDSLADRITLCAYCQRFFCSKYRRASRYCGTKCRKQAEKERASPFKELAPLCTTPLES